MFLLVCLCAPMVAGFIRKFVPNQPNWIEPLVATVVSLAVLFLLLIKSIKTEKTSAAWFMELLVIWFALQFLYLLPAMFYSLQMAAMAFCVRLLPMFGAYMAIKLIQNKTDLRRIADFLGWFSIGMLPLGILVMLNGNKLMPFFLQPIKKMVELGRDSKGGFDTCALVFNTEVTLSFSFLAITFLLLANLQQATKKEQFKYWLFIISAISLIYISTQRGSLWVAIGGLAIHFLMQKGKKKFGAVGGVVLLAIAFLVIDNYSKADTRYFHYNKRSSMMTSVDLNNRYQIIFIDLTTVWLDRNPFGAFLGFAGPENQIFGTPNTQKVNDAVEVGAALLAAEMGYVGLIGMPIFVFVLIYSFFQRSQKLACHKTVMLLSSFIGGYFIIFYMKYGGAMTTLNMAQISFWAFAGIAAKLITVERRYIAMQNAATQYAKI